MTVYELYTKCRPDRIDELATMGILDDIFHADGSPNWDYINHEMSEDRYDELCQMRVFDELEHIEHALTPNSVVKAAYSGVLRHRMSAAEAHSKTELYHYGMPRRSGRYPWGSGDDPYQHEGDFMSRVKQLRKQGMSEKDVANAVGCKSTTELRAKYAIATNQRRADEVARVKSMLSDGYSQAEIARAMGKNESTIRSLMNEQSSVRTSQAQTVADFLKKQVAEKGMIDVGVGVERELGISREKLNQAIEMLKVEGYAAYGGRVPQATNPGKLTTVEALCPPGTDHKELFDAFKNNGIKTIRDYRVREDEAGKEFVTKAFVYPKSMDSSRLAIRYAEDGGVDKDGVIEIRRGLKDLNLGNDHYAQVRILVDGKRYLKGMAIYSDDLPDGVSIC